MHKLYYLLGTLKNKTRFVTKQKKKSSCGQTNKQQEKESRGKKIKILFFMHLIRSDR